MALTKAEIIESAHDQLGFPKRNCSEIVETLLEIIKSTLESDGDVLLSGFGKQSLINNLTFYGRFRTKKSDLNTSKNTIVSCVNR